VYMKSLTRFVICCLFLVAGTTLHGQTGKYKFGHINSQELLSLMPERDSAQLQLERYVTQLQEQLEDMQVEYQNKVQKYLAEQENYTDLIRQNKEQELADLQERIQNFQVSAQEDMQAMEARLLQPIVRKAEQAVRNVAEENGFTYVFDISRGAIIYFSEDSQDILPLVKQKLGLE